jgi:aryl-alcohol dehydrogenase-like predicted oxidoreductase
VQQRLIGPRSVSSIGLGGMPMSIEGRPDAERSISTIHAALDAGVTVIDSADAYHRDAGEIGHNEELIARALRSYGGDTSGVLVATKGGRLVSVQNQFSPTFRSSRGELEHCAELGIAFLPWSPLGGIGRTAAVGAGRPALQCIAEDRGVSVQQVILAWELALAPTVIPIPGASRPASIQDSVRAADLELTADEISKLSDTE